MDGESRTCSVCGEKIIKDEQIYYTFTAKKCSVVGKFLIGLLHSTEHLIVCENCIETEEFGKTVRKKLEKVGVYYE